MLTFLKANIGTIVVLAVLVLIIALIIRKLVKDKKNGVSSCGCDCSTCGCCCQTQQENQTKK